jgi:hypothetical protein
VASVTDTGDYPALLAELRATGGRLSLATRFRLMKKAFAHTAAYDAKNRLGLPDEMPFDFAEIAAKVPGTAEERNVRGKRVLEMPKDEKPKHEEPEPEEPESATDSATSTTPKPTPGDSPQAQEIAGVDFEEVTTPEVRKLHELMNDSNVNGAQLMDAVGSRKNNPYTAMTQISEYSAEFIRNTLIKHWDAIVATVRERDKEFEDIPF